MGSNREKIQSVLGSPLTQPNQIGQQGMGPDNHCKGKATITCFKHNDIGLINRTQKEIHIAKKEDEPDFVAHDDERDFDESLKATADDDVIYGYSGRSLMI